MATTVGQHSVAAFTSPVNGTTPIDANTVRGNDNTVRSAYVDHDADPGIHVQSSTLASRPAAGTAGRKWITEDSGVYTLWFDDGTNWHPVSSENVALTVLAGENLVKGDVVKVTGWNNGQDLPEVAKVSSASDTAFAIITAAVTSGAMGYATNTGIVQDLATNGFSFGATLYPNTSGGFTATKPTSGTYQPCAYVLRSNANNGVLYVEFSAPRIVERSDNTASTIVLRDASGNFSAGTITAGALTSTGLVTFASLKGTGATTVTNILDEDNMASDSATALATQQSIKAYVDSKVATVDTLAEVLANGNTTGANDIVVNSGQKIRTPLVAAQDGTSAITIANTTGALTLNTALADSNLATISTAGKVANSATTATSANTASAIVARDSSGNFTAGTITATLNGAAPAGSLSGTTLASNVVSSSLTSVGTLANLTVTNPISGSVTGSSGSTTGNAATATALQTARNINGVSFNGTADITVTAAAGTLTGTTLASGVTASSLTSVGTLTSLTVSGTASVASAGTVTSGFVDGLTVAGWNALGYNPSVGNNFAIGGYRSSQWVGIDFYTSGTKKANLDASGNLGLGVTPSAWLSAYKVFQNQGGSFASSATSNVQVTQNAYLNASTQWIYTNSTYASQYSQTLGQHQWYTAASGTAGTAISFTQAMTLDASGNLGVGTTSPAGAFEIVRNSSSGSGTAYPNIRLDNQNASGYTGLYFLNSGTSKAFFELKNDVGALTMGTGTTERARITSGGYFKASNDGTYYGSTGSYHELRTDAADYTVYLTNKTSTSGNAYGAYILYPNVAPNGTGNSFLYCQDSSAPRAAIRSNGGLANYQSNNVDLSDARTKNSITPAASMWDKVAALEIVTYKYNDQTHDDVNVGVIAQQVESVEPVWVDADGFGDTPEGEEPLKTVYTKDITFAAIKALQEAMARIEALEARLEALEA